MDKGNVYYKQVQMLIQVLPLIASEKCFALKGGTAINLFVRELPRLSVDIDLIYLPIKSRDDSLKDIQQALGRISSVIEANLAGTSVYKSYEDKPDALRLIVHREGVQIKVELSPVLRGTVYGHVVMSVSEPVEIEFGYAEMQVVSMADLYAGKICAALDRQHPRDLFDIKLLLENEGLTDELRKASLVYLISHNRPIAELLSPTLQDISALYESEFSKMTVSGITVHDLVAARAQLIQQLKSSITSDEKEFLLSFKQRSPDWDLLGLECVENLPAVRWKLFNLKRMSRDKHADALQRLQTILSQF